MCIRWLSKLNGSQRGHGGHGGTTPFFLRAPCELCERFRLDCWSTARSVSRNGMSPGPPRPPRLAAAPSPPRPSGRPRPNPPRTAWAPLLFPPPRRETPVRGPNVQLVPEPLVGREFSFRAWRMLRWRERIMRNRRSRPQFPPHAHLSHAGVSHMERATGTVKWFSSEKGFGFIK